MKNAYIRFLNLLTKVEQSAPIQDIDIVAKHLLDMLFLKHHAGESLTVTDAMNLLSVASPATIHRKLDILHAAGLIEFKFRNGNRRTKYLEPTPLAEVHYKQLEDALISSFKTP